MCILIALPVRGTHTLPFFFFVSSSSFSCFENEQLFTFCYISGYSTTINFGASNVFQTSFLILVSFFGLGNKQVRNKDIFLFIPYSAGDTLLATLIRYFGRHMARLQASCKFTFLLYSDGCDLSVLPASPLQLPYSVLSFAFLISSFPFSFPHRRMANRP